MEGRIIIKSDQEPGVKRLVKDVAEARVEGKSVVEERPASSSESNGVVERRVQALDGVGTGDVAGVGGEVGCDGGGG